MKVLLIHPLDTADTGDWARQRWDRIVDLGRDGGGTYERWHKHFDCPVETLNAFRNGFEDFYQIRELLGRGCGYLVDECGLDWWEILSIHLHEEMETLGLLQRFAKTIDSADGVHVSRPGLHANILRCLLGERVRVFRPRLGVQKGPGYYAHVFTKLSTSQVIDILGDKYDSGYQLRGRLARKRVPLTRPVVLVPTAYVNVTRTGVAYANTFPSESFLLVATRRSGWIDNPPTNVATAWLSSYVSDRNRSVENADMENRLYELVGELSRVPEFEILNRLGHLGSFPSRLRRGIEVRDAWRNVLDSEPVEGVLCADDSNPHSRIPLLLARERGLASIACHHGALDARYLFKRSYGGVVWVKGKMEQDYLVRKCCVPQERVEICAPALPAASHPHESSNHRDLRPYIVFFSELYEVTGGRAEGFYRDILPPLAELALATNHKLVVKLHPAESKRERTRILARLLSEDQVSAIQVISGPLTEDLLAKTWCAVTILSTVSTECAVRGIPCFLCKWLEAHPYEYVEQYLRFGVGVGLTGPGDIAMISQYLQQYPNSQGLASNLYQPAPQQNLRDRLSLLRSRDNRIGMDEYAPSRRQSN
jgi:hypothetical protein